MFREIIFEYWREELAREITQAGSAPAVCPIPHGRYIAMSGLQKGIRRGDLDVALGSAARLLTDYPRALWRRLCVIAFEDIGVADLDTVTRVVSACGNKDWRLANGGEWLAASYLIQRMCVANKDRCVDDLIVPAEHDPQFQHLRDELPEAPVSILIEMAGNAGQCIEARAIAAWYAVGTERIRSETLHRVSGHPVAYFDGLIEQGVDEMPVELGRTGLGKTGTILPVSFPLVWQFIDEPSRKFEPDDIPEP